MTLISQRMTVLQVLPALLPAEHVERVLTSDTILRGTVEPLTVLQVPAASCLERFRQ